MIILLKEFLITFLFQSYNSVFLERTSMDINRLFNIDGKTALITGGSRGIVEMIAAGFLANGVKVYITARKEAPLIEKAKEL